MSDSSHPVLRLPAFLLGVAVVFSALPAAAQGLGIYDTDHPWPLCGRITENPPMGWTLGDPCPADRWGDPAFHDGPISSTFGPRQLPSDNFRFDFHRGLDLPTPIGTPAFAIADGEVIKAGVHPSFDDPVIEIRHFRPGFASCAAGGGCYSSLYLHMSAWDVMVGESVVKGKQIGETGASDELGFEHLHFEIRDAPPQDPFSSWQRDAVHPLGALPYPDAGADNIELTLDEVDVSDPMNPLVTLGIRIPISIELDLERVEVEVFERGPGGVLTPVVQPGDTRVGNTIEGDGYAVNPPWYSMNTWCRHWTYKDSGSIPWESFLAGGLYESPYEADLPMSYDPNVHMDRADAMDPQVGLFNGMSFAPLHYNDEYVAQVVTYRFLELVGTADAADLCIKARAVDASGNATADVTYNCPTSSCPDAPQVGCRAAAKAQLQISAPSGIVDRVKWGFRGGPATDLADFLAPNASDAATYSLCVYDDAGGGEPLLGMDIPTGVAGACGAGSCWKPISTKGYKFKDKSGTASGITGAKLKAGAAGKTGLKLQGRGAKLPSAPLPLVLPATVQMIVGDGMTTTCWESSFTTGTNEADSVKLKMP
jgi:murein DD-endopeptidase MepM/ murein hydrolase activator NlpD